MIVELNQQAKKIRVLKAELGSNQQVEYVARDYVIEGRI